MDIKSCIEKTKHTAYSGLIDVVKIMIDGGVPEKIVLEAIIETYINVVAHINKHSTTEVFQSMCIAENYLIEYCDKFREEYGVFIEEDDEKIEEEETNGN